MPSPHRLDQTRAFSSLRKQAGIMNQPDRHLKNLMQDSRRLEDFAIAESGFFFDYSRQRLDAATRRILFDLAREMDLPGRFNEMCSGAKINTTENRAVLHTAARSFSNDPILVDDHDIMPEIRRVRAQIDAFSAKIHAGEITGSTGKRFRHVVVIGIGGSYLGTEFVSTALSAYADKDIRLHYLANVDVHNFGIVASQIDPESTLWIIISKSFTTAETEANGLLAEVFMREKGLEPARHTVTVTAKGSPGDDPGRPVLQCFHMFDYIGGRYSVTSAVGGVPLSLYLGYERFKEFLRGASLMDQHARQAPVERNIPLVAGLLSVWNTTFLRYCEQAVIAYATPLAKLAPHVQQLNMESNGKAVDIRGHVLPEPAGTVIFGEPGTNAQHSFFQLAHQGRPFPTDFIGVLKPQYDRYKALSRGVDNHQELWANMLAQAQALAMGRPSEDKARDFSGNRPSSTIVLEDLSPSSIGRLLSFYEARTAFEGFIWGINSFDQFGVELGKTLADSLRRQIAARNQDKTHCFENIDPVAAFYLEMLSKGSLPTR